MNALATRKNEVAPLYLALLSRERRRCEKRYFYFFEKAWPILEPLTKLKLNWHIEYLCDELQAEAERIGAQLPKGKDIIINIPPRSAKSSIASVFFCPWVWTNFPHLKFINSSHSSTLSVRHCVDSRRVIESPWYTRYWGNRFEMAGDQNVKSHFQNDKTGYRIATSVGGSITGQGADIIVYDDPIDPLDADSEANRVRANDHYDQTLYSRLNDQEVGLRVIVMQRIHADDPTGHVMRKDPDNYRLISIPAEENDAISPPELREKYQGGNFFPDRFPPKVLEKFKTTLGSRKYAGQIGQKISPDKGNIIHRQWFRFYKEPPIRFDKKIQSWDMSFKDGEDNSYVVGQLWGKVGVLYFLLYQFRKQMDFPDTLKAVQMVSGLYPGYYKKIVEPKANGPGIVAMLKTEIAGIQEEPMPHGESKESRLSSIAPVVESGCVILPNADSQPWVLDFIEECVNFPNAANDDQVDAFSQAISYFEKNQGASLEDIKKFPI